VLDKALAQPDAEVRVVAYDLNLPDVVDQLEKLGPRLRIIIDNSASHGKSGSAENAAADRLAQAGAQVKRQHMASLQHNKTIVVHSAAYNAAVCGSTNFSWRAFYVQSNNAMVLETKQAADIFGAAFELYWTPGTDPATGKAFQKSPATAWTDLQLPNVPAKVTFSPHAPAGAVLDTVAGDVGTTTSSLLFSLAFLYQTAGAMRDTIQALEKEPQVFVYGMSDRAVGGLDLKNADGHFVLTQPGYLDKNVPEPFKSEPSGMAGIRLHHKFLVVDFDKPTARVYMGSFNFSVPADQSNGENLLVIKDQRVATAYMVEALRLFDHYEFRAAKFKAKGKPMTLAKPPAKPGEKPWWDRYWSEPLRAKDRILFS
jgi:phosphatidylserine/phosphatidylglycerophosphate/cardiolipin synthase-like enzyme